MAECLCGCGKEPKMKGAKYFPGHYSRIRIWNEGLKGKEYLKHFKEGKIWNKGLTKETDERIRKYAKPKVKVICKSCRKVKFLAPYEAKIFKYCSHQCQPHVKGDNANNFGKRYPKDKYPNYGMRGKSSWSKGLTKETDERLRKLGRSVSKSSNDILTKLERSILLTDRTYPKELYPNKHKPTWSKDLTKKTDERIVKSIEKRLKVINTQEWQETVGKEMRKKISEKRKGKFNKGSGFKSGNDNPSAKFKGKSLEERFGEERAGDIRNLMRKPKPAIRGDNNPSRWSEVKEKKRETWYKNIDKNLESRNRHPNNLENDFTVFITPIFPNVQFTGDCSFWVRLPQHQEVEYEFDEKLISKSIKQYAINPDYVMRPFRETHKVIEIFGNYWHTKENEYERIALYKSVGIDCLVVWENDFRSDREKVLERVKKFVNLKVTEVKCLEK